MEVEQEVIETQTVETQVEAVLDSEPAEVQASETGELVETSQEVEQPSQSNEEVVKESINSDVSVEPVTINGLQFQGHSISLTIPEEAVSLCQEKGFDVNELAKELYSSDDFSFSEETRSKLDKAYGKFFTDSILAGLKAQQLQLVEEFKSGQDKAFQAISDLCEGEEGWGKLEAFAATLPKEDIDNFNEAMLSGNKYMQRLAVSDLVSRMSSAGATDSKPLNLVEGTNNSLNNGPSMLSRQEFLAVMKTPEYKANPSYYDNLRRIGMANGI